MCGLRKKKEKSDAGMRFISGSRSADGAAAAPPVGEGMMHRKATNYIDF